MAKVTRYFYHGYNKLFYKIGSSILVRNSATDRDVLSCNPSCFLRDQQKHSISNILRCTSPISSSRDVNRRLLEFLIRVGVGSDWPWSDRVDGDLLASPPLIAHPSSVLSFNWYLGKTYFFSPRPCKAINSCFGSTVDGNTVISQLGCYGANVDNSTAWWHNWHNSLSNKDWSFDVHVECLSDIALVGHQSLTKYAHTCVIHYQ